VSRRCVNKVVADKIRMSFSPEMRQLGSCFGRLDEKESRYVSLERREGGADWIERYTGYSSLHSIRLSPITTTIPFDLNNSPANPQQ
jgi:hypothetical protein